MLKILMQVVISNSHKQATLKTDECTVRAIKCK